MVKKRSQDKPQMSRRKLKNNNNKLAFKNRPLLKSILSGLEKLWELQKTTVFFSESLITLTTKKNKSCQH